MATATILVLESLGPVYVEMTGKYAGYRGVLCCQLSNFCQVFLGVSIMRLASNLVHFNFICLPLDMGDNVVFHHLKKVRTILYVRLGICAPLTWR